MLCRTLAAFHFFILLLNRIASAEIICTRALQCSAEVGIYLDPSVKESPSLMDLSYRRHAS